MIDQLDLHSMPLPPARVHALQHFGPVLAFGPPGAGIDLNVCVIGIGLSGQESRDLVAVGASGQLGQRANAVVDQGRIAFRLGHFDQLGGVGQLAFERLGRADCLLQAAALTHDFLRRLGIVPQRRILDLCIQLVEPLQRAVPIEEAAQQLGSGIDLVDVGLRFSAH